MNRSQWGQKVVVTVFLLSGIISTVLGFLELYDYHPAALAINIGMGLVTVYTTVGWTWRQRTP